MGILPGKLADLDLSAAAGCWVLLAKLGRPASQVAVAMGLMAADESSTRSPSLSRPSPTLPGSQPASTSPGREASNPQLQQSQVSAALTGTGALRHHQLQQGFGPRFECRFRVLPSAFDAERVQACSCSCGDMLRNVGRDAEKSITRVLTITRDCNQPQHPGYFCGWPLRSVCIRFDSRTNVFVQVQPWGSTASSAVAQALASLSSGGLTTPSLFKVSGSRPARVPAQQPMLAPSFHRSRGLRTAKVL